MATCKVLFYNIAVYNYFFLHVQAHRLLTSMLLSAPCTCIYWTPTMCRPVAQSSSNDEKVLGQQFYQLFSNIGRLCHRVSL